MSFFARKPARKPEWWETFDRAAIDEKLDDAARMVVSKFSRGGVALQYPRFVTTDQLRKELADVALRVEKESQSDPKAKDPCKE